MTVREQFYAVGVGSLFLGLIIARFWEGWGGLLSLLGWGFLAILAKRPAWDLPFSIPAAMGLLHLVCWWGLRGPASPQAPVNAATRAGLRMLFSFLWVSLAAFILLCANEIFGQPPLMTRTGRPPAGMVGTWYANLTTVSRRSLPDAIPAVFTIGPDGSVSGTVGNAALTNGHLVVNRSWFGRLMNWRTDYVMRGNVVAGGRVVWRDCRRPFFGAAKPKGIGTGRIIVPVSSRGTKAARAEPQEALSYELHT
jgi:hypothetical protein